MATEAEELAQSLLRTTPAAELLTKAYQLTHQMHGMPKRERPYGPSLSEREADLRAARDLITAELIRRTAPAHEGAVHIIATGYDLHQPRKPFSLYSWVCTCGAKGHGRTKDARKAKTGYTTHAARARKAGR